MIDANAIKIHCFARRPDGQLASALAFGTHAPGSNPGGGMDVYKWEVISTVVTSRTVRYFDALCLSNDFPFSLMPVLYNCYHNLLHQIQPREQTPFGTNPPELPNKIAIHQANLLSVPEHFRQNHWIRIMVLAFKCPHP
ncbi:hypothetical protein CEXT_122511 [Caerostris extrusa]|uniref:Uncharacterized protein n=1 Tax=Caerostris extrusa TaxID=172846 RepID=A0AAV4XXP5_CAEEX|nr:hypothetical protein CEXT_122511 [Caerostris extrusa]